MASRVESWRLSPARMARHLTRGRFVIPPHVALLDRILVRAASEPNGRYVVSVPVRHGKSEINSRWAPVWFLSTWPERTFGVASYGHELASGFGRFARDRVREHAPLLGIDVDPASSAADRWAVIQREGGAVRHPGGEMFSVGVGGPLTGRGLDLLVIDDAHKDAAEALSQASRDAAWRWFDSVASTRLEPGGSIVVVMSRWHSDDLAGRLLKRSREETGDQWTEIRIPALAEDEDPLDREPGEALWPARYDRAWLEHVRDSRDAWVWAALYAQRPVDIEEGCGLAAEDLHRWTTLPTRGEIVLTVDAAFADPTQPKKGKRSKTAVQAWLIDGGRAYLIDRDTRHMGFEEQEAAILAMHERHGGPRRTYLERAANGYALIARLSTLIPGVTPVDPQGSKFLRFSAVVPNFKAGTALVPPDDFAPWVRPYVETITSFPNVDFDDDVDATSQVLSREFLPHSEKDFDEKSPEQIAAEWMALAADDDPHDDSAIRSQIHTLAMTGRLR